MKFNSIQVKLPLIIILGFALTTLLVQFVVEQKMMAVLNTSQEAEYGERLQTILQVIQSNHERLLKTGMVATYQEDFQDLTLRGLRRSYSQSSNNLFSPFIFDSEGKMLLASDWLAGDSTSYGTLLVGRVRVSENTNFTISLPEKGDAWCVFRPFEPWGWTVGYLVPLTVKYQVAQQLNQTLLLVFVCTTLLVVTLLVWLVRVQLRPISELTAVSVEMAQGHLERRIQTGRSDEIGILADNFNRMQLAIQRTIESLRQSEERLSLALAAANSGIWDWNLRSGAIFFDENYFRMAGYEPDEFERSFDEWKRRVHPDDLDAVEAAIDDYLSGCSEHFAIEFRFKTKSDGWMWILSQGVVSEYDQEGKPVRFTGTQTDINARKQAEEALRRSEENLRTTLDSIGDAVIATDAETRITRMNPVAEKLTGWTIGAANGQPLENIFRIVNARSRELVENPARKVLADGEIVGLAEDTVLISKNGSEYLIDDSGAPIRNAEGEMLGVVLVFRDVTDETAMQEQLQQSRKMDTIGQLAGGVAHDFNNMLGGIIGATELLKRRLPSDPKTDKFLGMIMESAERAADLTSKLLAFSRKQHVSSTPVDAHLALRNSLGLLENTVDRRIRITSDLGADTSMVVGDMTQLQNIFLNLCINASQAMPDGGELTVATKTIELDKVYCDMSHFDLEPGSYLEVEVRDTGCGIPADQLERIFEPFFTTKEQGKGTGLGLAAVLGTVQMHKGAVNVYSEVGAGTAFNVLLPLSTDAAVRATPVSQLLHGSGTVLVVDDEAVMRATAAAILEDLGYQVLLAENGLVGLEIYHERQADIDLVLLDMIMPEMNGRDCFAELQKIDPEVSVLLSSGFTRSDDLSDLRAAGLLGFIRKPYRGVALSQAVAAALGTDRTEDFLWGG